MFDEYTDIVTIDELQEMLRIGRSTAYKLLRSGQIKANPQRQSMANS